MLLKDLLLLFVGAIIGFISSIGIMIVQKLLDRFGNVNIFYQIYKTDHETECFGYVEIDDEITFVVPLLLELQNTSNINRIIRDLSIILLDKGTCLAKMTQVAKARTHETSNGSTTIIHEKDFGSNKNSYSFLVPAQSIQREFCNFVYMIKTADIKNNHFDEIRLQYFDERNHVHLFKLRNIENCWSIDALIADDDWQMAK